MFEHLGWWFPDGEKHFPLMLNKGVTVLGKPEYQSKIRDKSLEYVTNKRIAIDIGANVGLWARPLATQFETVIAFEPVQIFLDCLKKNMLPNTKIFEVALGNEFSTVDMNVTKDNMGQTHVNLDTKGKGSIPLTTLDNYDFNDVDYIKIDCEGFELAVLQGSERTLIRNKPIVVVEQKPHPHFAKLWHKTAALDYLEKIGMRIVDRVNDDYVLAFKGTV